MVVKRVVVSKHGKFQHKRSSCFLDAAECIVSYCFSFSSDLVCNHAQGRKSRAL